MARWRKRREWRAEFRALGVERVRAYERGSIWHETPEKLEYAREWMAAQERRPVMLAAWIGAGAVLLAAVAGAVLTGLWPRIERLFC